MARHFFTVWIVYWAAIFISPTYSVFPATVSAFLVQASFVAIVGPLLLLVPYIAGVRGMPAQKRVIDERLIVTVKLAIGLSIVGLAANFYDKLVVQGIDFSGGVAVAREHWRQLGEDRGSQISSPFSVLGYLFGSTYFLAVLICVSMPRAIPSGTRVRVLAVSFVLLMLSMGLTGGRTNLPLMGTFLVGALSARQGLSLKSVAITKVSRVALYIFPLLAAIYAVGVFYARAQANNIDPGDYVINFLPFLGLQATDSLKQLAESGPVGSFISMIVFTVNYVTHSFATTAAIMDGPEENKVVLFLNIANILAKLGVIPPPDGSWFLAGRMPSLPGALWHQGGAVLLILGSIILGLVAAIVKIWTCKRQQSIVALGLYALLESILLLSPLLFAADFMNFPYIAASLVLVPLLLGILRQMVGTRKPSPMGSPSMALRPTTKV